MIQRFLAAWRYVLNRGWEDAVRPLNFPLHLSKGDIIIMGGREYRVPANMRFETLKDARRYARGRSMTDPIIHLRCTRTSRLYRVVAYDAAAKTVTLKGKNGSFTEPFDPARFKEMGYERIIGPVEGAIELEQANA